MNRRFATLLVLGALAALAAGAPAARAAVSVHVQYLDVPAAEAGEFAAAVTGPVRQLNLDRLARGEIFAWYHYSARFPSGLASDYTDVIVTVFKDFSSLEDPAVSQGYRGWVRDSEVYQGVPGVRSEDYYGKVEYSHITVDFLTAGPAGSEAFMTTMREELMPRLQARADAGEVVNWALFERRLPVANGRGYEYGLVTRYRGFGNPETPQVTGAAARHLHESVVWQLLDIVE